MKKRIIVIIIFYLICSVSDIKAIKIGSIEIKDDLAQGYKQYSGWYGEPRTIKNKFYWHWSIDIPCPEGTPIKYALQGQVYDYGEDDPILIIRT